MNPYRMLCMAARAGSLEGVKLAIERGAPVTSDKEIESMTESNNKGIIDLIPGAIKKRRWGAMLEGYAAANNIEEVRKLIPLALERGCAGPAIKVAFFRGYTEIVRLLLPCVIHMGEMVRWALEMGDLASARELSYGMYDRSFRLLLTPEEFREVTDARMIREVLVLAMRYSVNSVVEEVYGSGYVIELDLIVEAIQYSNDRVIDIIFDKYTVEMVKDFLQLKFPPTRDNIRWLTISPRVAHKLIERGLKGLRGNINEDSELIKVKDVDDYTELLSSRGRFVLTVRAAVNDNDDQAIYGLKKEVGMYFNLDVVTLAITHNKRKVLIALLSLMTRNELSSFTISKGVTTEYDRNIVKILTSRGVRVTE